MKDTQFIRNFCIISHIDHGKSTLADRFLEITGTVEKSKMRAQYLDQMEIERERGITIKMAPVRMIYHSQIRKTFRRKVGIPTRASEKSRILKKTQVQNNSDQNRDLEFRNLNLEITGSKQEFVLNLIDTPGHVDFSYEVSRSLACVEGAILLVDATQGIQAQTLSNLNLAREQKLTVIPVINKIDLPSADIEKTRQEIESVLNIPKEEILLASAKEGMGVREIIEAVIERIPPPKGDSSQPTQALVFDSAFDPYKGVIVYTRIINGKIGALNSLEFLAAKKEFQVLEVGHFKPQFEKSNALNVGEIGYIVTGLKKIQDARVGDTIAEKGMEVLLLPGYKTVQPFVFASFYSSEGEPRALREALEKLKLNDSSLVFEPEKSPFLGTGFRCGFLGLLHLEIVQERLSREYNLDLITTSPSVSYKVLTTDDQELIIDNPSLLPEPSRIKEIYEPLVSLKIITPASYLGPIMELAKERRGIYQKVDYLNPVTCLLKYEIPLSEILVDFYDQLKSISKGYASFSWDFIGFRKENLVKMDILVAQEKIEPLSFIVPKEKSFKIGQAVAQKLKEVIPKQQFAVSIQASLGGKVIARETISPYRKDVTAKLYGGDYTRKRKLLEKQKAGKKRMKRFGKIEIPQEAFLAILKR